MNPSEPQKSDRTGSDGTDSEAAEAELLDDSWDDDEDPRDAQLMGPDTTDDPATLGGFDLGSMIQMAQDMSARVGEAQAELAAAEVEGSAGGGLVRVVLNGHLHLRAVHIDPAVCDPDDPATLEDLLLAAWTAAHDEVAKLQAAADPLGGLGGAAGLGGLGDLGGLLGGG